MKSLSHDDCKQSQRRQSLGDLIVDSRGGIEQELTYHGLLVLGLHGLGDLAHLDSGPPPPLPDDICPERQLDEKWERPAEGHSNGGLRCC